MKKRIILIILLILITIPLLAGRVWTHTGRRVEIIGYNAAVGATDEPIWINSGALPALLASAELLTINSSSANDDGSPVGTGARTLRIVGLDTNSDNLTETITMNGTTDVNVTTAFLRVNYAEVMTVGSGGVAAGNITIFNAGKTVTLGYIPAGYNNTLQAIYTVPADRTLMISDIFFGELESKDTTIKIKYRITGSNRPWLDKAFFLCLDDIKNIQFKTPIRFDAQTDVYLTAASTGGSGIVTAGMIGYLE